MYTQFTSEVHTVLYALLSAALFTYLIILHAFLSSADFLQGHFLKKKLSEIPSESQTVWNHIRPNVLSGLIWVQTVCKGYQQKTLVSKELSYLTVVPTQSDSDVIFCLQLLKTYAAISNAHLFRVCKRGKLSGSCLSTLNGFGSTQLPIFLCHIRVPTFSSQNN